MSLIAITVSTFGFLFVFRTLRVFRARALVGDRTLFTLGVFALASFGLLAFFTSGQWFTRALVTSTFAALTPFIFYAVERRRLALLKAHVPLFLDRWILNLRLGASVAAARERALDDEPTDVRALLRPVFIEHAAKRPRHLLLAPGVLRELDQIARSDHAGLPRLEALRQHLRDSDEFRRRSGQAVRQAAIQAVVMLCLLIALAVYTVHRYGWAKSGGFVTTSALLSLIGTYLMGRLARKTKWKL